MLVTAIDVSKKRFTDVRCFKVMDVSIMLKFAGASGHTALK